MTPDTFTVNGRTRTLTELILELTAPTPAVTMTDTHGDIDALYRESRQLWRSRTPLTDNEIRRAKLQQFTQQQERKALEYLRRKAEQ